RGPQASRGAARRRCRAGNGRGGDRSVARARAGYRVRRVSAGRAVGQGQDLDRRTRGDRRIRLDAVRINFRQDQRHHLPALGQRHLRQRALGAAYTRITHAALDTSMPGRFAIKVITERNSRRIAEFAFRLARKRKAAGGVGKVTASSKYNMLRESELFRRIAEDDSSAYPHIGYVQVLTY